MNEVQRYNEKTKRLISNQRTKAKKFLEEDCIGYSPEKKHFYCDPIEGYNSTSHVMMPTDPPLFTESGSILFKCTCQWWQKVLKPQIQTGVIPEVPLCSHTRALYMAFRKKQFKNKEVNK